MARQRRTLGNGRHNPNGMTINGYDPILLNRLLTENASLRSRQENLAAALADPRRSIEDECGYPPLDGVISVDLYKRLFDRNYLASKVVHFMAQECWQMAPEIVETDDEDKDTEFEIAWDELGMQLNKSWCKDEEGHPLWFWLREADVLSGIGHFGVLLIGIDDGKALHEPIDGVMVTVNGEHGRFQIPDCPISEEEEKILKSPPAIKAWTLNSESTTRAKVKWEEAEFKRPELNSREKRVLESMTSYRACVENAAKQMSLTANRIVTSDEITGTDKQYSWQSSPPPSMSPTGTDAQYYGVQFGQSEELAPKPSKKKPKLTFLRAFDEPLVQIVRYEWNIRSPRFGEPVMYRITLNDPREVHSGIGLPMATVFVHWTRVVHLADKHANSSSSKIFAPPRMRPVLDNILAVRKLHGAAPEGYWKACFTKLSLETHPQLGGDVLIDEARLAGQMEDFSNSLQPYAILRGMHMNPIAPTVVDPTPFIGAEEQAVCIKYGWPLRVFQGSERGQLASGQDDDNFGDRKVERNQNYTAPMVVAPVIDRFIVIGLLPEPEQYIQKWPGFDGLSQKDEAVVGLTRMQIVQTYVQGGCEAVVTPMSLHTDFLGYSAEEATKKIEEAEQHQTETEQDNQDLADKHGFEPAPPPGFQTPEPEQPQVPPNPVAVKPGDKLVHPVTGKTIAKGGPPPAQKPGGAPRG